MRALLKNCWLRSKTSAICTYKNHIKISNEYATKNIDWGLLGRNEKIVEGWREYVWWRYQMIGFMTIWYKKILAPENLRNDQKFWKKIPRKHIIKMNTKTVRELRSIAKDKDLPGFYKLKKLRRLTYLLYY